MHSQELFYCIQIEVEHFNPIVYFKLKLNLTNAKFPERQLKEREK